MILEVEQVDIQSGDMGSLTRCALALALQRQFNLEEESVRVSGHSLEAGDRIFHHTKETLEFMRAFDEGSEDVYPGVFELLEDNE